MGQQVAEEELAALLDAQQDVRRAQHSMQSSRRLDERQQAQPQLELDQAEARLNKLRLLALGPVIPKVVSHSHALYAHCGMQQSPKEQAKALSTSCAC